MAARIDLRDIVDRIRDRSAGNEVATYEQGRVVRRSFAELGQAVRTTAHLLRAAGVEPGMRVGIRAPNSYGWMIHELALIDLRAVSVAFTADFADTPAELLCSKYDLALMLPAKLGADTAIPDTATGPVGAPDPEFERPGLIFSSGSAGGLKGMVLNRRGIEASVEAFAGALRPRHDDRLLLFLPMSNFQQRLMYYAALWYGFDLIVVEPVHLFRALKELSPTIVIAPPAFFEAIENRVASLPVRSRRLAHAAGKAAGLLPAAPLRRRARRAIFAKVHEALGDNIRFMVTGMAPIKRGTLELFQTMGLPLFETYGLIESGSVALNVPGANRIGSVGRPLAGVQVALADDGEIIVRREHPIAVRYFECAEGENERTFVDGAVVTGDIGRFDSDGFLYLVGRKKEVIVTGGGEKIHPAVIEADIAACPDIACAVVIPRQSTSDLAAIVAPRDPRDAQAAQRIHQFVDRLNAQWRNVSVGKVVLTDQPFSLENGFLRPNLKLDRTQISKHFAAEAE